MPLFKGNGAVRPVGVEPSLVRAMHKEVNKVNKRVLAEFLQPQQFAMSIGCAEKLVNSVRMLSEANPDFIVVKCDIKMPSTRYQEVGFLR